MTYDELGYSKFFKKVGDTSLEQSDSDFDLSVQSISADKITEGISQSTNLKIDYNQGQIIRSEGATTRLEIGKFIDSKFGLRVYDAAGNIMVDSSS